MEDKFSGVGRTARRMNAKEIARWQLRCRGDDTEGEGERDRGRKRSQVRSSGVEETTRKMKAKVIAGERDRKVATRRVGLAWAKDIEDARKEEP